MWCFSRLTAMWTSKSSIKKNISWILHRLRLNSTSHRRLLELVYKAKVKPGDKDDWPCHNHVIIVLFSLQASTWKSLACSCKREHPESFSWEKTKQNIISTHHWRKGSDHHRAAFEMTEQPVFRNYMRCLLVAKGDRRRFGEIHLLTF